MIVDVNKLVRSVVVEDVQLVTVGDLLSVDRVDGLQGGMEEFERRYPSQNGARQYGVTPVESKGHRQVPVARLCKVRVLAAPLV